MKRSNMTEAVIRGAAKHPYLLAALICLLINPFFLGSEGNIPNNALWLESMLLLGVIAVFGIYKYRKGDLDKSGLFVFMGCAFIAYFNITEQYTRSWNKAQWHFWGGCAVLLILYCLAERKKYREQLNSLMIIGVGFLLKLYYVVVTSVYTRQHGIEYFGSEKSHTGYIDYILYSNRMPDFDMRERLQIYHPPLHHAICAIWIYVSENILGTWYDPARESLQTLTLFYSMCIVISAYKIMRHFGLKGKVLYIPLAIVSFHPSFILFSGSINNDALSVALMMGAVAALLEWYKDRTKEKIIPIAVCLGCALMTKLSAAMLIPPVAMVFIAALLKDRKTELKGLLKQFACFLLICVPLGLWFGISNYVRWNVPLTYVDKHNMDVTQSVGEIDYMERITDFSSYQITNPYVQTSYDDGEGVVQGYNEFNPLVTLMKSSLFDDNIHEGDFETMFPTNAAVILFLLNVVIAAAALVAMIVVCVRRPSVEKLFFALFYVVMIASFFVFAEQAPFTSAMNFRYITPTVIIGALFIGLAFKELLKGRKWGDTVVNIFGEGTILFALGSSAIYLSLR